MDSAQENKLKKYIIKNSPYGETKLVLDDLARLVDNMDINESNVVQALKEHNEEHLALATFPNDDKTLVLTKYNAEDDLYIDQKNKLKHTVNHHDLKITNSEPFELTIDPKIFELRDILDGLFEKYVADFYKDKTAGYLIHVSGDQPSSFAIHIVLTAKNLNLKNLYGGEWNSEWKLTENQLEGTVKINAHYFEDGNVQLKVNKAFTFPISWDEGLEASGKGIVNNIKKSEDQILTSLNDLYETLPTEVFKTMRKEIPYTKTKMDWNLHVHRVMASLKSK